MTVPASEHQNDIHNIELFVRSWQWLVVCALIDLGLVVLINYFILLAPEKVKEWGRGEDKRMYSDITI